MKIYGVTRTSLFFSILILMSLVSCANEDIPLEEKPDDKTVADYTIDGHFLVGKVYVPLGDRTKLPFTLHVQRHTVNPADNRTGDKYTNIPLVFEDGRTLSKVYEDMKAMWVKFYQDMIDKGMPTSEIRQMLKGITG